ncbi:MAG: hypothetical protein AAB551_02520 [Patescibacteria group bacterium]
MNQVNSQDLVSVVDALAQRAIAATSDEFARFGVVEIPDALAKLHVPSSYNLLVLVRSALAELRLGSTASPDQASQ